MVKYFCVFNKNKANIIVKGYTKFYLNLKGAKSYGK